MSVLCSRPMVSSWTYRPGATGDDCAYGCKQHKDRLSGLHDRLPSVSDRTDTGNCMGLLLPGTKLVIFRKVHVLIGLTRYIALDAMLSHK